MVGRDWRLNSVDSRVTCRVNLDGFVISTYNTQTIMESVLYRFGSKSAGEVTLSSRSNYAIFQMALYGLLRTEYQTSVHAPKTLEQIRSSHT